MIIGLPIESFVLMLVLPAIVVAAMFVSLSRIDRKAANDEDPGPHK